MLACSGSCTRMVHSGKLWRIIHELYANSAKHTDQSGRQTELYRISSGSCPHVTTLNVQALMIQTTFRRNATMTASPYRPHSIASGMVC
jgi:two-component sensor histidine kinase